MSTITPYEVLIIGGSYAGMAAAMALGRAGRSVLLIDSGKPCNRQTPYSHNFLTQDGQKPAVIAHIAKEQVLQYPSLQWLEAMAVSAVQDDKGFTVTTDKGEHYQAKKLLFATGVRDQLEHIPGLADCWGISVLHCPYCHGYEVRGRQTGIIASGEAAMHMAILLHNWTDQLAIFSNGPSGLNTEQIQQLAAHNIRVDERQVQSLQQEHGMVHSILFTDGTSIAYNVIYAHTGCTQHCPIPEQMGCEIGEDGRLVVEASGRTNIPDIFAAGDNSRLQRTIATSVASGTIAGITINGDLCASAFRTIS